MISREDLIENEKNWHSTENLNLDVFSELATNHSNNFYLRLKKDGIVLYGKYLPNRKRFECYIIKGNGFIHEIKRNEISHFICLPSVNFNIESKYSNFEVDNQT